MTFETKFGDEGASQQIPEEREFQARKEQVQGTCMFPEQQIIS